LTDTNKGEYYYGMGRRKTSVARVRVFPNGDGSITVNGREAQSYFGQREAHMATIAAPFRVLDLGNKYTMTQGEADRDRKRIVRQGNLCEPRVTTR
jgi:small subunit ribosomal protein S9